MDNRRREPDSKSSRAPCASWLKRMRFLDEMKSSSFRQLRCTVAASNQTPHNNLGLMLAYSTAATQSKYAIELSSAVSFSLIND